MTYNHKMKPYMFGTSIEFRSPNVLLAFATPYCPLDMAFATVFFSFAFIASTALKILGPHL